MNASERIGLRTISVIDKYIHHQLPTSLRAILNCIVSAGCRSLGGLEIAHHLFIESNKFKKKWRKKKYVLCHLTHGLDTAEVVTWHNRSIETESLFIQITYACKVKQMC